MDTEGQTQYIERHRAVHNDLRVLRQCAWIEGIHVDLERQLTKGLLEKDYGLLSEPHRILQGRVEFVLRDMIDRVVTDKVFSQWCEQASVPEKVGKTRLNYTQRLKLASYCTKQKLLDSGMTDLLAELFELTVPVRNAVVHQEWEKLTADRYADAIRAYCRFLDHWDPEENGSITE